MLDNFTKQEQAAIRAGLLMVQAYENGNLDYAGRDWSQAAYILKVLEEHGKVEDMEWLCYRVSENIMMCSYCPTVMDGPQMFWNEEGHNVKQWACLGCGALERRVRIPGEGE